MDDLPSGLGDRDRSPNFGMQWEVNDTQMRHTIRAVRRKPLTIGKLLGVAGCFAIVFATASYAENFGSWVLFFFFKQKTAYEIGVRLVGSEMCIRDRLYHH